MESVPALSPWVLSILRFGTRKPYKAISIVMPCFLWMDSPQPKGSGGQLVEKAGSLLSGRHLRACSLAILPSFQARFSLFLSLSPEDAALEDLRRGGLQRSKLVPRRYDPRESDAICQHKVLRPKNSHISPSYTLGQIIF